MSQLRKSSSVVSQSFQSLTAIVILHNFADELYTSEPDGCARLARLMSSVDYRPNAQR
jgi:hypothetical protein